MHDSLFEGFYKRLERTPHRIAIDIQGESISFEELYGEINELGGRLLATRAEQHLEGVLPLFVDRSLKSAIAIYAALWASIPFTVIDEETPLVLARQLLSKIGVSHPIWNVSTLEISDDTQLLLSDDLIDIKAGKPTDLAYVILTSGSTGVPKGVMNSRENIVRNKSVNWFDNADEVDYSTLAVAPFAFAMGIYGLFRVSKGASYYNLKPSNYTPRQFFTAMKALSPTHLSFPSQFARLYSKSNVDIVIESVQEIATGGETIRLEQVKALMKYFPATTKVLHSLGASEGSSGLQWKKSLDEIEGSGQIPMSPTPDASLLVPLEEYGEDIFEVWSGLNLALGYHGNDELTQERFVEKDGRRWWKSGDLVRHIGGNEYVHFGRKDDVIKISGYLVSPMTVSNALMTLPNVNQASVVSEKLEDRYVLHAFLEVSNPDEMSVEAINISLKEILPSYMIPTYTYIVDQIPLTIRGKTDVKSLLSQTTPLDLA